MIRTDHVHQSSFLDGPTMVGSAVVTLYEWLWSSVRMRLFGLK